MGFFSKLFGSNDKVVKADGELTNASRSKIQLIKDRAESVSEICLTKGIDKKYNVVLVIDRSYSMENLYESGSIQELIERLIPVAINLDKNKEIDVIGFNQSFKECIPVTMENFNEYTKKVLDKVDYGGTNYSPVINFINKKYKDSELPTYVMFITDGETGGRDNVVNSVVESSNYPIFFQFIGIGGGDFYFLRHLDDLECRRIDNADFFHVNNLKKISDDELYNKLMTEYPGWIKEAKKAGIIK